MKCMFGHDWRILSQEVQKSFLDYVADGVVKSPIRYWSVDELSHRPVVVTKRCAVCHLQKVERV